MDATRWPNRRPEAIMTDWKAIIDWMDNHPIAWLGLLAAFVMLLILKKYRDNF